MLNYKRYKRVPVVNFPERTWPDKEIEKAPVWCWTIRRGTKAPQAAGKIHSDFERGFIRASVVHYDDFAACGYDMAAVKAKGLQHTEGKEYVVQDGDIIEFLFNV